MSNFMASWLVLFLCIIMFMSHLQFSISSCIPSEQTALLQFKSSLVHDASNRLSSWREEEDCCNWEGIGCNKNTGHVVKFDLRSNGDNAIQGEISSSLLALEHLNYLDLSRNNFSSGIQLPAFVGSLKNLRYLNLSSCGFRGNVPPELGNLSHLQYLDLSVKYDYAFTLTIYSLSWITNLSSLRSLDLTLVYLSGCQDCFHSISMLPSLVSLRLRLCHLILLPSLKNVNNLTSSLTSLDLSWNFINSSTIPMWLFNLTSLEHLDLSYNLFYGLIPDEISQLSSLTSLELTGNNFMSPMPNSLGKLSSSLSHLLLGYNKFGGLLPVRELCNLTSLKILDLSKNKFHGSISREIGCFKQLSELRLSSNKLNGTIPSSLGLLKNLEFLYLSSNSLTGEMSEVHFARMKKLKHLNLSSNSITPNIKSSWIPPFHLEEIHMDSVIVGPSFPPWLRTQKNLKILTMSNASISDKLPDWFEIVHSRIYRLDLSFNNISGKVPKFSELNMMDLFSSYRFIRLCSNKFESMPYPFSYNNISELNLVGNHISGPIPSLHPVQDLAIFDSLEILYLSDNHFNGSIPESICQFRSLKILDLSNNQLSGKLPLCLGDLKDLLVLKVANNSLHGEIPSSLGNIEFLQSLRLNKNKFNGELPLSMQLLIYMQFLDLGENEFQGIIPSWIGENLSKLRVLRLQSNHFHGDVPIHLCQLSNLQVLSLARNNFTGSIPICFNNISAMASHLLDTGPFFYGIDGSMSSFFRGEEKLLSFVGGRELEYHSANIRHFRSLDLSQNYITGEIPNQLMDLMGLNNLNLSRNRLTGNIPERIGNLKELLSLDMSMNELSGSIPPSLGNLNFLSYLNLSSNKLSGRIPMGNQLQTLDDPSIYAGNNGLCGKPLSNNCSSDNPIEENESSFESEETKVNFSWFLAGLGPGFTFGILGILSIFVLNKSWRNAYFRTVENLVVWRWNPLI